MKHPVLSLVLICLLAFSAHAAESESPAAAEKKAGEDIPEAETYTSEHEVRIAGKTIKYTATAGTLILRDGEDKPVASLGYTAYVRQGTADLGQRPIMFAYNGGPGSSSLWLHMGILGPRRAVANDLTATSAPYQAVNNEFSVLDRTDIVMIDPVGTGLSRAVGDAKGEDFWGVTKDAESLGNFINRYVTANSRWRSPKYLLGESYGAMRSAVLVHHMQTQYLMDFSGVVLVSPFLSFGSGDDGGSADLPYVLYLPTLAATAWSHDAIADKPADLAAFLAEVKQFARDEYAPALLLGSALDAKRGDALVSRLARYTGLSEEYWRNANLRVSHTQFVKELLRSRGEQAGRVDSRFSGVSFNLLGEQMDYDPFLADIGAPFTAAFKDYYHEQLKVPRDRDYHIWGDNLWMKWDWKHASPGSGSWGSPAPNTAIDLAYALGQNPNLRVLVQQGHFDLATPEGATEYDIDHLNPRPAPGRVQIEYYDAGHMMYLHPESMAKFREDLVRFLDGN